MTNDISEDKVRLERLEHIRSLGLNPYPSLTDAKEPISSALSKPENTEVSIAGRLVAKREMGKISFSHLKDATGKIQIAFSEKN
jgi:lysyl-tRNA synthetase class 2